jgi:hypothetical protein
MCAQTCCQHHGERTAGIPEQFKVQLPVPVRPQQCTGRWQRGIRLGVVFSRAQHISGRGVQRSDWLGQAENTALLLCAASRCLYTLLSAILNTVTVMGDLKASV